MLVKTQRFELCHKMHNVIVLQDWNLLSAIHLALALQSGMIAPKFYREDRKGRAP